MTANPGSEIDNWILGPANTCVLSIGNGSVMAGFLKRAVTAASHQGWLLDLAREKLKMLKDPSSLEAIDRLIAEQDWIANQAREIADADFHPLNVHGVISLWVAIEVAVEDTAMLVLMKDAQAANDAVAVLKRPPKTDGGVLNEGDARKVFDRMTRQFRDGATVMDGYRALLNALKINVNISEKSNQVLSELNYVRNCLLHRGGIVDSRVEVEAPGLNLSVGTMLQIGADRYSHYYDAAAEFATTLIGGVVASPFIKTK
jgi:hypothetical protein